MVFSRTLLLFFLCFNSTGLLFAADADKSPHQIINGLRQRMYVIGETSGQYKKFIYAEQKAIIKLRHYISNSDQTGLIERNKSGQTPLMASAFMGYAGLAHELLQSDKVKSTINDTNPKGLSAWAYASLAYRQTAWVCNPKVFSAPFTFVPLLVTQPYYRQAPENPYHKIKQLLEDASAQPSPEKVKQFWMTTCKFQDVVAKSKIQVSQDIQKTLLEESNRMLADFLKKSMQKKLNKVKK